MRGYDDWLMSGEPGNQPDTIRRHSAEVTSDRLVDAVDRWWGKFTSEERDMIGRIRHALNQIATGAR
jgi:hypothetical protein